MVWCVTGTVPYEICGATKLTKLWLDGNDFSCFRGCLYRLNDELRVDDSVPVCQVYQDGICGLLAAMSAPPDGTWSCDASGSHQRMPALGVVSPVIICQM